jgi:hypothetical protein
MGGTGRLLFSDRSLTEDQAGHTPGGLVVPTYGPMRVDLCSHLHVVRTLAVHGPQAVLATFSAGGGRPNAVVKDRPVSGAISARPRSPSLDLLACLGDLSNFRVVFVGVV